MDKFQDAYREAAQGLPKLSMDAEKVRDGMHHRRMQRQKMKYVAARGCTAAAIFLLCGAGTAAAKNYRNSVIQVGEGGFIITSIPNGANTKTGGVFTAADAVPDESGIECYEDSPEYVFTECGVLEYDSLEEFLETGSVVAVDPHKELFGVDFAWENVRVMDEGREVFIILSNEDSCFLLNQFDNSGYESYSMGISFGGEAINERSYTNSQGLSYVVFDAVDESGRSVHAVISVDGWDLSVTFSGFEEEIVERVLDALDLTVYVQDELFGGDVKREDG